MADSIKKLIKQIKPVEPDITSLKPILKEIRRLDFRWWWRRRLILISGVTAVIAGALTIFQTVKLIAVLDTVGFWALIRSDNSWPKQDPLAFLHALLAAHPLKSIGILVFISLYFIFLVRLFRRNREESWDRLKGKAGWWRLIGLLVYLLFSLWLVYWVVIKGSLTLI